MHYEKKFWNHLYAVSVNDRIHLYVNLDQPCLYFHCPDHHALGKLKTIGLRIKIFKEALQQMKLLQDEDNKTAREFWSKTIKP